MAKRKACNGTTNAGIQAQCYQHKKDSEKRVPVYHNVTKVLDYAASPKPEGIFPYARPFQDCVGGAVHAWAVDNTCGDGINGEPFCQPWPTGSDFACSSGDSQVNDGPHYHNCYHATTESADLSTCRKGPAFKSLQVKKAWYGMYGPLSEEHQPWDSISVYFQFDSGLGYNVAAITNCPITNPVYTADPTRYLKVSGIATIDQTADSLGDPPFTAESTMTDEVGRYTGVHSVSGCSDSHTGATDQSGITRTMISLFNINKSSIQNSFETGITSTLGLKVLGSGYDITFYDVVHSRNVSHYVLSGNTLTIYGYGVPDGFTDPSGWDIVSTETTTLTDTTVHYELQTENSGGFHTKTFDATFSLPYTSAEVYNDIVKLRAGSAWDFNNDIQMPPRQDAFTSVAPLLSYNEYPNGASPDLTLPCLMDDTTQPIDPDTGLYPQIPWVDSNSYLYDGSVLGNPVSFYSPEGHVNFTHRNWAVCFDSIAGTHGWYIRSYGAVSGHNIGGDPTDLVVPLAATQWTENFDAIALDEGGAWQKFDGLTLWIQEWLEIPAVRPSQNFAEPCGIHSRYLIEETSTDGTILTACLTGSVSGSTFNLSPNATGSFASGDAVFVGGVSAALNGVRKVTRNSPTSITLTTTIVTSSQMPADNRDYGTGLIGKLRFPWAPAVCGDVKINKILSSNSPVSISLVKRTALHDGDNVFVKDLTGVPNGQYPVGFLSDKSVALIGTTFADTIKASGVVYSPMAANEDWNDNAPKGNYTATEFIQSLRDYQEVDRYNSQIVSCNTNTSCSCPSQIPRLRANQTSWSLAQSVQSMTHTEGCLAFSNCDYQAVLISLNPSQSALPNGTTYPFTPIAADGLYGNKWNMIYRPQVTNALWQKPAPICACGKPTSAQWVSDDGTCQADSLAAGCDVNEAGDTRYYAYPPQVESLQNLPTGAPGLPAGCFIGFLSQAEVNVTTQPQGNVAQVPIPPGRENVIDTANYPKTHLQNWSLWTNQKGCVDAGGRFEEQYTADGIAA